MANVHLIWERWTPKDSNGLQWAPLDYNGLQWTTMDSNGLQWTPKDYNGLKWTTVGYTGLQWAPLDYNGVQLPLPFNTSSQCPSDLGTIDSKGLGDHVSMDAYNFKFDKVTEKLSNMVRYQK